MKFKYQYVVNQISKSARIELFGRNTRLTNDELELMRRKLNRDGLNQYYIKSLGLIGTRFGADSRNSKLPLEPMFQLV